MIQRVERLLVDGALCPGLARVRDARERKTCCLSVALTEGAAAAAAFTQPSRLARLTIWSLHSPFHHHHITRENNCHAGCHS